MEEDVLTFLKNQRHYRNSSNSLFWFYAKDEEISVSCGYPTDDVESQCLGDLQVRIVARMPAKMFIDRFSIFIISDLNQLTQEYLLDLFAKGGCVIEVGNLQSIYSLYSTVVFEHKGDYLCSTHIFDDSTRTHPLLASKKEFIEQTNLIINENDPFVSEMENDDL